MKIYLAGPMTGKPLLNFPAFEAVTARLREMGHTVYSPAERDLEVGYDAINARPLRDALADDLAWICAEAEGICLLPGWEDSTGAKVEKALAEALGIEVMSWRLRAINPIPIEKGFLVSGVAA